MFTIPNDFQTASEPSHPVRELSSGCVVAYRTLRPTSSLHVLFTQATLVHVRRGTKIVLSHSRRAQVRVHEGSVLVMPPGTRVMSEILDSNGHYESTVISLNPTFLAQVLPELLNARELKTTSTPQWSVDPSGLLSELMEQFSERVRTQTSERLLALRLQEIAIVLNETQLTTADILNRAVQQGLGHETHRLKTVMEQHVHEPLRLHDYAALCGRSLASFKRDFKRVYQCAPGEWLIQKRLRYAATLLEKGELSVTDVCFECGFGNLSHFIRTFGRAYDVSPKQFQLQTRRNQQRQ